MTITETVANCQATKCVEISNTNLSVIDSINQYPYCDLKNGSLTSFITGGILPYEINITGPNGFSYTSDQRVIELNNLEAGKYTTSVTDAGGCTKTNETKLEADQNHVVNLSVGQSQSCDSIIITANVFNSTNPSQLEYSWSDGQKGKIITVGASGTYCVTVTEGSNCSIENCIDVDVTVLAKAPYISSCDKNIYIISNDNPYQVEINSSIVEPFSSLDFNVITKGYGFSYFFDGVNCGEIEGYVDLPYLTQGLVIDSVSNTSCATCKDGQIFFTVNSGNDCFGCNVGNTGIYSIDDTGFLTDLTADNNAGALDTGSYYVVVTDAGSGCIISHKLARVDKGLGCLPEDLKQGIVLFYPFSNGSINDMSGNGHNLKKVGEDAQTPTADRNNNNDCAYGFVQGAYNSYLFLPYYNNNSTGFMDSLKDFSLSLWYQSFETEPNNNNVLFEWEGEIISLKLSLDSCNRAQFSWTNYCKEIESIDCQQSFADHNWHHLVGTYNKSLGEMKLYKDGILQDTKYDAYVPMYLEHISLGSGFKGKLDDVILYNRTLSPEDVLRLKNLDSCCE